ncbi:MAG: 2-oxoacid:acceptor oxidoreductase family protein [Anaerolineae bacterium]|nr:2-oxoacid:acceptor oxidoreductase family protein [Anaerolineae bacterium]
MIEIRIHGRGGQGAVIASKVLATAVFLEGKFVQSFPSFGVERRGAPVTAFTRIDDHPIRLRCQIYEPDHLIVLDPTLVQAVDVTVGLKPGGKIVINSSRPPSAFSLADHYLVATVDASAIAVRHRLGPVSAPIVNTAILGAFARVTGLVGIEALREAVRDVVPVKKEANVAAMEEAYDEVRA